jgi:hypothetical protein
MANFTEIAAGPWPKWAYNNMGLVVDLVLYVFFSKTKMIGKYIFYIPSILQKYMVSKFFCKTIHQRRGGRRQGPTAAPHGVTACSVGWWLVTGADLF